MSDAAQENSAPVNTPQETAKPSLTIDPSKLEGVKLTLKQKRALGLVSAEETEKQKARNEVLRQRMLRINEERKKAKAAAVVVEKPKKAKRPPPVQVEESSSSSDEYIQRKAKKVKKTIQALNSIDERLAELRKSNPSNPFFSLLCR